jgi:lipid II:glycine glycyltransferase (peptidoglycan interpeptide bridge formation enzyme)
MIVATLVAEAGWDETLLRLPFPHVLQSNAWAAHKGAHGWSAGRWEYREGGRLRGAALALRRRVSRLPLSILYVPKGPLLDDWGDATLVETVLTHLEGLARRQGAIFIKVDPDVAYADAGLDAALAALHGEAVAQALRRRGWRFSADQIQYRNTVLSDLRGEEPALLAAMKAKTRYNIGLATRKGVTMRMGGAGDLPLFYRLYAETSRRDGFLIREYPYYQSAWQRFMDAGLGCLLLAEAEGEAIAGVLLFRFGRRAWYMYGASADGGRERMPNHLLQWEAMRWARAAGCTAYDWWGAPDELQEGDPMWGVYRFKAGFGGAFARHIGAWDYAPSRLLYDLYAVAIPRYLAWLRGRRGGGGAPAALE